MTAGVQPARDVDLLLLLGQAKHTLHTELMAGLGGMGLTPRAYCVLAKALDRDLTQSQLADLCSLDKTTMVVTMDELERAGLAERRPCGNDRRARIIAVTEAGEQALAEAREIVDGVYDDVLDALPEAEREAFVSALTRLAGGRLSTPFPCPRQVRRQREPGISRK